MRSKLKNPKKWLFLALYRDYWMIRIFPGKSGRVTFLPLWMFNFMQKIGTIVWLEVSKFWGLTTIANIVRFRLNWTALEARDSTLVLWNHLEVDILKITNSWRPLICIEICNMKSIQWIKLEKMTKNWSKQFLLDQNNFLLNDSDAKPEWYYQKSWRPFRSINIYAIQSRPIGPNLRKWSKTGQNRSFCTNVTLLLNDPDAKHEWHHYQIIRTV